MERLENSNSYTLYIWLVVYLPLWKIWKLVGMIIPNIWKNKKVPNHQPDIICIIYIYTIDRSQISHWQIPKLTDLTKLMVSMWTLIWRRLNWDPCNLPRQNTHYYVSQTTAYSNFFKTWKKKKTKKKEKPESKSAKCKKHKSKIKEKKKKKKRKDKKQKNKKGKNMDLSICIFLHLFCFFDFFLLLFCFFLLFSRQEAKKKAKKKKKQNRSKKTKKQKKATKMQMDKSIFSCFSPFWRSFFSHLFCFLYFSVLKFCFLIFHLFSFFCIFSSLKIFRISHWGEHKPTSNLIWQWKISTFSQVSSAVPFKMRPG